MLSAKNFLHDVSAAHNSSTSQSCDKWPDYCYNTASRATAAADSGSGSDNFHSGAYSKLAAAATAAAWTYDSSHWPVLTDSWSANFSFSHQRNCSSLWRNE